jgi:hypothetical protein
LNEEDSFGYHLISSDASYGTQQPDRRCRKPEIVWLDCSVVMEREQRSCVHYRLIEIPWDSCANTKLSSYSRLHAHTLSDLCYNPSRRYDHVFTNWLLGADPIEPSLGLVVSLWGFFHLRYNIKTLEYSITLRGNSQVSESSITPLPAQSRP